MTGEQEMAPDVVAMAIVADHGDDAAAYVMEQIADARGVANIMAWHDVGLKVAALLQPKGRAN